MAGPGGVIIGGKARRITINKNKTKGGQICIEEYTQGTKAKVGKTLDDGTWEKPSADKAITREIISVKSFNISEIQMVDITLSNLSTLSEEMITIKRTGSEFFLFL